MNDADRKAFDKWCKAPGGHLFYHMQADAWQAACEWRDSQVLRTTEEDPCPACRPNTVCRTPSCGRLKGKRQEPIAPPTAQINQQMLEALKDIAATGYSNIDRDKARAALAATQMRGDA